MIITRRGLFGMFAAGAAAAIIRTPGLLMPIKPVRLELSWEEMAAAVRRAHARIWRRF